MGTTNRKAGHISAVSKMAMASLFALVVVLMCAAPALSGQHNGHHKGGHYYGHSHGRWCGAYGYGSYGYYYPPVVYSPPPVVYAPPPTGINIVFPVRIH